MCVCVCVCVCVAVGHSIQDSEPRVGVFMEAWLQESVLQQHTPVVVPLQEEQIPKIATYKPNIMH